MRGGGDGVGEWRGPGGRRERVRLVFGCLGERLDERSYSWISNTITFARQFRWGSVSIVTSLLDLIRGLR